LCILLATWAVTALADSFLLDHIAREHGIPLALACQIPADSLRELCAKDQAQDLEDWR
jgi:hypothetical protein